MKLEKLTIRAEGNPEPKPIEVLFNPNSITITQSGWISTGDGLVAKDESAVSLTVELFVDTGLPTDSHNTVGQQVANGVLGRTSLLPQIGAPKDARKYTDQIMNLTVPHSGISKSGRDRPPICRLSWGKQGEFFKGVLISVTQTLTRFGEDGTALRATLSCEFEAWEEPEFGKNPIDDPIRIVKRGETLSSIAAEEYGNPNLWRVIADENKLMNPRRLEPGEVLTVPPLPR